MIPRGVCWFLKPLRRVVLRREQILLDDPAVIVLAHLVLEAFPGPLPGRVNARRRSRFDTLPLAM